MPFFIGTIKCA